MTSEKQILANKDNALLGGVKTEEGKMISKFNALKHGLLSQEVLLEDEDEQSLVELGKNIRRELKPAGELEMLLVERIISNIWRLRRALEVERASMEWRKNYELKQTTHFNSPEDQIIRKATQNMIVNEGLEKIIRYETAIERSIYKALHELQRIQAVRTGQKIPAPLAIDIDVSKDE